MTPPLLTITRDTSSFVKFQGFEIERLMPSGTISALIEWPLPPGDSDETMTPLTAAVLCSALLRSGHIAFRWDDAASGMGGTFFPEPPPPSLKTRVMASLLHGSLPATFGVLVTDDEIVARNLFVWGGWSLGGQAALVYDPAADPAPIVDALQHGMDWSGRTLPPGCKLLFGSGHDGGVALVAASSVEVLNQFIANVEAELAA